jgi:hypothetical protein
MLQGFLIVSAILLLVCCFMERDESHVQRMES